MITSPTATRTSATGARPGHEPRYTVYRGVGKAPEFRAAGFHGRPRWPFTAAPSRGIIPPMENLLATFAAFFFVALLAAMIPGVDTALVTKNALGRGAGSALLTAAGCSTGQLFWGAASAFGVAAVLAASATAYSFVKLAGAVYLVYLGVRSLLAALSRERPAGGPDGGDGAAGEVPLRASYAEGLVTNLLNPKTALFFSSLVPQFVSPGDPNWLFAVLTVLTAATSLLWLCVLTVLLRSAGAFLRRPGPRRVLDGVMGTVLVALGVRVALSRG